MIDQSSSLASGASQKKLDSSRWTYGLQPEVEVILASSLPNSGPVAYFQTGTAGAPRIRITGQGASLKDVDCSGCYVTVEAFDVIVSGCVFTAVEKIPITVDLYGNAGNVTFERCHFDGQKKNTGTDPILRARSGVMHVKDCLFENLPSDGISTVGGSIERNVMRGSGYLQGAHADAITMPRLISPLIVLENDIDFRKPPEAPTQPTSVIAIGPATGDITDVLVERNILRGGGYSIYVTDAHPTFKTRRVIIRDNLIDDWLFGPLYPKFRPPDLSFEGNRRKRDGSRLVV